MQCDTQRRFKRIAERVCLAAAQHEILGGCNALSQHIFVCGRFNADLRADHIQIAGFFGSHGKHDSSAFFGPLHDLQHMLAQTVEIRHGHHYGAVVIQRWKFSVFVSHVNRSGRDFHIKQNLVEHGFGIADTLLRTVNHQQIRGFLSSDGIGSRNGFGPIQIRDVEPRGTVMHAQALHQQHQSDGHEHGPDFDQTLPAESLPLGQHV